MKAQTVHRFTEGLVAGPCHRYGREAVAEDQLAYQLYSNTLLRPQPGQQLLKDEQGKSIQWRKVEADSAGKFRDDVLGNGYLYTTYESLRPQKALLNVTGNSMCFVNGEPRGGDIYSDGWMNIPVSLKKGLNEIYIRAGMSARWQGISARLIFPEKEVLLSAEDVTLPDVVVDNTQLPLLGGMVVINTTAQPLKGLTLFVTLAGKEVSTRLPDIGAQSKRKVGFTIDATGIKEKGTHICRVSLRQNAKVLDHQTLSIQAVANSDHHSNTFVSNIDGSVQYYSVSPPTRPLEHPALFLSVHGAGVQAIGQARAYKPKEWGVLVAPTNRRPRGFNWEDWGRMDALEVLAIAKEKFKPDPQRIYLTGHSMGGHGTWYLGATYPDHWAAIAPCAGYPTLTAYGSADGKIPEAGKSPVERMLLRASNASQVTTLARNYSALGIYIHHGDSDKVVSVNYARQMRKLLGEFHRDFSYYEYPGGSHWFGNESVDWPPIFDYFKWHTIAHDSTVNTLDFTTANPGIAYRYRWAAIHQQQHPLELSHIHLTRDVQKRHISGETENVSTLALSLKRFQIGDTVSISLDSDKSVQYIVKSSADTVYLRHAAHWQVSEKPNPKVKNNRRYGTFKEAFNHRMVLVYGTRGNTEENQWAYNKARYDAEVWYYRGNGAVDLVADKDFNLRDYADRGVILYGNETTNSAWKKLLANCPIQVSRGEMTVGKDKRYTGNDIGAYFIWPRPDSEIASVAVISGTGLPGMRATEANQYFAAGSGFPDYVVFSLDMLKNGVKSIRLAGFYGNDWTVENGDRSE